MDRLVKPRAPGFSDDHVVLEPHTEFAIDANGRLVRECHAGFQHGLVTFHEIGPFVHVETDTVASAVRQAGGRIAWPETAAVNDPSGGDVDVLAANAGLVGIECSGLCRLPQ